MTLTLKLRKECAIKLHPTKIRPKNEPRLHAVIACLLKQRDWLSPNIVSLTATSDGHLLGRRELEFGFDMYLGTVSAYKDNLDAIAKFAGLTDEEATYLTGLLPIYDQKRSRVVLYSELTP